MPPRRGRVNTIVLIRRCRRAVCSGPAAGRVLLPRAFREFFSGERFSDGVAVRWADVTTCYPGQRPGRPPPTKVVSVTVIRSENQRAQPINRPWGPRNCTGRAPFSEKFSGKLKSMGASRGRGLGLGHHPAELLGGAPAGFPTPPVNEELPGKGDDGPFAGAAVGLGIEEDRFPFLDQIVMGLVEQQSPGVGTPPGARPGRCAAVGCRPW